jgi:hypothetical protein
MLKSLRSYATFERKEWVNDDVYIPLLLGYNPRLFPPAELGVRVPDHEAVW